MHAPSSVEHGGGAGVGEDIGPGDGAGVMGIGVGIGLCENQFVSRARRNER